MAAKSYPLAHTYPSRDQSIISPSLNYQSNYARSLQNQHQLIEQMQTGEIEYNRFPTLKYNPSTVQAPNQPIEQMQTGEIEYNRVPTLTYNPQTVQVPN